MSTLEVTATYEMASDAGYIYLTPIGPGEAKHTIICDDPALQGSIHLDLDKDGRLIGIEFLSASRVMPLPLLRQITKAD